jgi:aryl-alcohol dehydrogenase-like predicted oxidoreductase
MDYVDVVFAHAFDPNTPMEEICRGFNHIIEEGKAFHWATSNWRAENVYEAFEVCDRLDLHRPVADQMQYNMLVRKTMEVEFETLFDRHQYGITAWSPLAGGFLTGKYLDNIPAGSR